ncbi:hypothetical protein [Belliella pelovolcani]|uniref:hypothetical protein n=1 Tax=Belliella pelovolcani TaxID=529505 RepID=UPI00391BE69E
MKKLFSVLIMFSICISFGNIYANDQLDTPILDESGVIQTKRTVVKDENGKTLGIGCIYCDPAGDCGVLTCIIN